MPHLASPEVRKKELKIFKVTLKRKSEVNVLFFKCSDASTYVSLVLEIKEKRYNLKNNKLVIKFILNVL